MLRNFDIDQTGLVSTANLTKVLKLMGVGGLDGKVRFDMMMFRTWQCLLR